MRITIIKEIRVTQDIDTYLSIFFLMISNIFCIYFISTYHHQTDLQTHVPKL